MVNWYVSSVAYTAVQTWNALTGGIATVVTTGTIVRQTSPTTDNERCFRCTTGGTTNTTEPTWNLTNNSTTTDGTVVWTECAGQEAHQHDNGVSNSWTAPAARIGIAITLGATNGDSIYCSSDHAETRSSNQTLSGNIKYISVARTGSVPPVDADITNGATYTTTSTGTLTIRNNPFWQGFTFALGSGSSQAGCELNDQGTTSMFSFRDCTWDYTNSTGAGYWRININGGAAECQLQNCNVKLNATGGIMICRGGHVYWKGGTLTCPIKPTVLLASGNNQGGYWELEGVDLSALGSNALCSFGNNAKFHFTSCKLGTSFTTSSGTPAIETECASFVNCDSGNTNVNDVLDHLRGKVTTDTSTTLFGSNGTTTYSRKMVSTSGTSEEVPLEMHLYAWCPFSSGSRTATIEIISSGTLNNNDIWSEGFYLGGTSSQASRATCRRTSYLASAAAQTSSGATWANPPGTPQKQQLVLSFTPGQQGILHIVVRLAKASTTVWIDPLVTIA